MKLLSITLENYRQFYGQQRLQLPDSPGQNVTVIHGFNGAGKTALLNAFLWCLYGVESHDAQTSREGVRQLATERAVDEAAPGQAVTTSVALELDQDGQRFTIRRTQRGTRAASMRLDNVETSLEVQDANGNTVDADGWVERLLPVDLRGFFFVSGERIEELTSPKSFESVETGVKTLLDVEIFERSCLHFRNHVSRELARQLRDSSGTDGVDQTLLAEEQRLVEQIDEVTRDLAEVRNDVAAVEEEITALSARIREAQETLHDRGRLEELSRHLAAREAELEETRTELGELIANGGHTALAGDVWLTCEQLLDARAHRPDTVTRVDPALLNSLLQSGACICGRPVQSGSAAQTALQDWLLEADHTVDDAVLARLDAACQVNRQEQTRFERRVQRLQRRIGLLQDEVGALEQEQVTLEAQAAEPVDINVLQAELDDFHFQKMDVQVNHHELSHELDEKRRELAAVRDQIAAGRDETETAAQLRRRKASVDRLTDTLQEIAAIRQEVVRDELDEQIRQIWERTAIKGYEARLTDNYQLVLTKRVGDNQFPVRNLSTGERQILALSFVASLISQARRNMEEDRESFGGELGGLYPLVLDSPFGALDDRYRKTVAEWLPGLANQVVILVSNTQWRDEVARGLADSIGAEYVLELHTPKPDSDLQIELDGQTLPYVVSDETEWTRVQTVRRDHD